MLKVIACSALAILAIGCAKPAEAVEAPYVTINPKALYDVKEDVLDTAGVEVGLKGQKYGLGIEYLNTDQTVKTYNAHSYRYFEKTKVGNPYVLVGGGYTDTKEGSDKNAHYAVGLQVVKYAVTPKIELRHTYHFDAKKDEVGILGGLEFKF